jgi:replicative DNA helicase
VEGTPISNPIEAAKQLAELYQKRLLADLTQDFLERLRSESSSAQLIVDLEDHLSRVQQAVQELRTGQMISLPDLFPEMIQEAELRRQAVEEQGTAAVGLPTGIEKLDKLLGGLQPGLHLLAAEPGMGKTTFTLHMASQVARTGAPALFVSFEESLSRLALKSICQSAGLEAKRYADGYGNPEDLKIAVQEKGPQLRSLYLIEGTGRLSVSELKAKALQAKARSGNKRCLIVVDYLQRWASFRHDFSDYRHVVSGLVSELRDLALRLDSPVLVISSQNRPGQGSASLVSLKESGDLEYSADTAMFLVEADKRTVPAPSRAVDLVIEKNRYGDKGRIELIFKPQLGQFREEHPYEW